ncbi:histidine kinase [Arthrobacter sp. OY3WO11]|uniref:sensor histidine kinase n=1 Tax=Arthrobacter sp. OY3WO11 TaxID=1835723 RepID=UPI0012E84770|nr:histidine kinase [Arthrobacter sp. OY3WO11]
MLQRAPLDPVEAAYLAVAVIIAGARRRFPVSALGGSAVLAFLYPLSTGEHLLAWCLLQICLLSFAIIKPRNQAIVATVSVGVILLINSGLWLQMPVVDPMSLALVAWTAAAGGVGSAVHSQRGYVQALEGQAQRAEATRRAIVERELVEERLRIARELHDVMAHHIAAINVHAGSAEANLASNQTSSLQSLQRIRSASGEALRELQAILKVLRTSDTVSGTAPPVPDSSQLDSLFNSFRALGLELQLSGGASPELPPGMPAAIDLALYRVLQEGLTNAHKHGDGKTVVDVRTGQEKITVRLVNKPATTRKRVRNADGQGFGLIGMEERVAAAGGQLRITPSPDQFVLEAVFPLGVHE